jgi:hypothetical protein
VVHLQLQLHHWATRGASKIPLGPEHIVDAVFAVAALSSRLYGDKKGAPGASGSGPRMQQQSDKFRRALKQAGESLIGFGGSSTAD